MENSTKIEPLKFFISFLNETSINSFKEEFYNSFNPDNCAYTNVDRENECVFFVALVDDLCYGENTTYFSDYLVEKLWKESKKSKSLIDEFIAQAKKEGKPIISHLEWQLKVLTKLSQSILQLKVKYPDSEKPIDRLICYIKEMVDTDNINVEEIMQQEDNAEEAMQQEDTYIQHSAGFNF